MVIEWISKKKTALITSSAHRVGKAIVLGLAQVELAPGVQVNAIAPGPVLPVPNADPERIEQHTKRMLLGRWGKPNDVVHTERYYTSIMPLDSVGKKRRIMIFTGCWMAGEHWMPFLPESR